jgi:surfeit locus 1 family protein
VTRQRAIAGLALVAAALLAALGVWQVERLAWKRQLIATVDARLAAAPMPLPPRADWPRLARDGAYSRVAVSGEWLPVRPVLVQAVTAIGPGFWTLSPLGTREGPVLVNRGFVPAREVTAPTGRATVTGLLRQTEPGGAFLRSNDPTADRWFSRDVAAIARARGVVEPAPFFIDADRSGTGWPRGGLTVVRFRNHHLIYAITWFVLAGMALFFAYRITRRPHG